MLAAPQPADLVEHVSQAVPSLVICELLGVPHEQRRDFHEWASMLVNQSASMRERAAASDALNDFLEDLVTDKEQGEPTDDLIGRLIARNRDAADLDVLGGDPGGRVLHDAEVAQHLLDRRGQ
ncbi:MULTISPECIES: hypothetical protein [Streptomyces]|uniref:hypothetical protein n=1 Tax=Streptomyces TaxID=1883 RepID=UPI0033FF7583